MKNSLKIPEGWSVKKLGECFTFSAGGDVDKSCFSPVKDNIHIYPIFANAITNKGLYGYSSKYKIDKDCITITGRGEIGKIFYRDKCFTPIVRLITAIPNKGVNARFMSYACCRIHFFNGTTGVPQLTIPQVQNYSISIPPLPEQEKIAEILWTWDKAIEKLSHLIEQKKLLKKGLMQRLLTGKVRLFKTSQGARKNERFSQPWKEVRLSDILFEHSQKSSENEIVCSVSIHKGVVNQIEHLGRSFSAANTSNYNLVHYGDVIYTKSPTGDFPYGIFKQSQQKNNVIVSPLYGVFTPKSYALGYILDSYFSYPINMNNYLKPIIQKGAKNTINITNKTFLSKSLCLPTDIAEQQAIADVLTKADEEIDLLNKKLMLFKEQKKGLMQQLLTGNIRVKVN